MTSSAALIPFIHIQLLTVTTIVSACVCVFVRARHQCWIQHQTQIALYRTHRFMKINSSRSTHNILPLQMRSFGGDSKNALVGTQKKNTHKCRTSSLFAHLPVLPVILPLYGFQWMVPCAIVCCVRMPLVLRRCMRFPVACRMPLVLCHRYNIHIFPKLQKGIA